MAVENEVDGRREGGRDWSGRERDGSGSRKSFTSLRAYRVVFPTVLRTLELADSLGRGPAPRCPWLVERARDGAFSALACLSVGYNKYHGSDKAEWYDRARTALCEAHASLLALRALDPSVPTGAGPDDGAFEECISSVGSLIKLIESRGSKGPP